MGEEAVETLAFEGSIGKLVASWFLHGTRVRIQLVQHFAFVLLRPEGSKSVCNVQAKYVIDEGYHHQIDH